jgi:hypothetical protein
MKILIIYVVVALVIAYILKHQLNLIEVIPTKADVKLRNKINKKKKQLSYYLKLSPIWPVLLVKEVYDEIKERRQS